LVVMFLHQHAVLKPFMLRRVKKDVITEMTSKREVTMNCTLSSRQQAFYQAIKNKISVAELLDSARGHINYKKVENLMNIVIQLRKVWSVPLLMIYILEYICSFNYKCWLHFLIQFTIVNEFSL